MWLSCGCVRIVWDIHFQSDLLLDLKTIYSWVGWVSIALEFLSHVLNWARCVCVWPANRPSANLYEMFLLSIIWYVFVCVCLTIEFSKYTSLATSWIMRWLFLVPLYWPYVCRSREKSHALCPLAVSIFVTRMWRGNFCVETKFLLPTHISSLWPSAQKATHSPLYSTHVLRSTPSQTRTFLTYRL